MLPSTYGTMLGHHVATVTLSPSGAHGEVSKGTRGQMQLGVHSRQEAALATPRNPFRISHSKQWAVYWDFSELANEKRKFLFAPHPGRGRSRPKAHLPVKGLASSSGHSETERPGHPHPTIHGKLLQQIGPSRVGL